MAAFSDTAPIFRAGLLGAKKRGEGAVRGHPSFIMFLCRPQVGNNAYTSGSTVGSR